LGYWKNYWKFRDEYSKSKGFSRSNLQKMRALYIAYQNCQTLSGELGWSHYCELFSISDNYRYALRSDAIS